MRHRTGPVCETCIGVKTMVRLQELVDYTDRLLDVNQFDDYCPNGLQVQGADEVRVLVTGVTASAALVEAAAAAGADALLVHHGYFWKGEDPRVRGMKRRRLGALLASDMSLLAYHLPLDAHPQLGNNARLGQLLGFTVTGQLARAGRVNIGLHGELDTPLSVEGLAARIAERLGRAPLHVGGSASRIERIGWCTGAAQRYIDEAAALGLDAYLSGEISEPTVHEARESGVHYFAAGHHATERYGVQALGEHLAQRFDLTHQFIDIDNPV